MAAHNRVAAGKQAGWLLSLTTAKWFYMVLKVL